MVLVGGWVAGTWKTRGSTLEVTFFKEAVRPQSAALEAEAGRITAVLGKSLTLRVRSAAQEVQPQVDFVARDAVRLVAPGAPAC